MSKFAANGGATDVVLSFGAANGGFEYADRLRDMLNDALGGDKYSEKVYMDYYCLQNKPGTRRVEETGSDGRPIVKYLNDDWEQYYKDAIQSCSIFLFIVDEAWCSRYGKEEWTKTADYARKYNIHGARIPMVIVTDNGPNTKQWVQTFKTMSNPSAPGTPLFQNGGIHTPNGFIKCIFKRGEERELIGYIRDAIPISKKMNKMLENMDQWKNMSNMFGPMMFLPGMGMPMGMPGMGMGMPGMGMGMPMGMPGMGMGMPMGMPGMGMGMPGMGYPPRFGGF